MISVEYVGNEADRRAALSLLIHAERGREQSEEVANTLRDAELGKLSLERLHVARVHDRPVGAGLVAVQPDRSAFVWPPGCSERSCAGSGVSPDDAADALLSFATRWLDGTALHYAQALAAPGDEFARAALIRHGFEHLADLSYQERLLRVPLPAAGVRRLEFDIFDPNSEQSVERFAALLERTYAGSLDCPAFVGRRSGREALVSHRLAGGFRPEWFRVYHEEGRDVGVLLLVDHPDQDACEVAYMGLAPEARGRGLAAEMMIEGFELGRAAGREAMLLGVDRQNHYAMRLYARLGFREVAQRAIHLRMGAPARGR